MFDMKAGAALVAGLFLVVSQILAQAQTLGAAGFATNGGPALYDSRQSLLLVPDNSASLSETIRLSRHVGMSGLLVSPFKTRKVLDVPRRFLRLINPFARGEAVEQGPSPRDLEPRAWTTIVGWSPGKSAFPDATTQESCMGLLRFGRD